MRRLFVQLVSVLLVGSILAAGAVQAQEAVTGVNSCDVTVHHDGDGDQVHGDADNRLPHHHGSCGHVAGFPVSDANLMSADLPACAPLATLAGWLPSHLPDQPSRPPST